MREASFWASLKADSSTSNTAYGVMGIAQLPTDGLDPDRIALLFCVSQPTSLMVFPRQCLWWGIGSSTSTVLGLRPPGGACQDVYNTKER